eukprot:Phypoly_transcript_02702.p1 GENE.Phypoly_transcript_02702~~Phypoly_transcript_02702.p1  ORF type:complete len:693 (+),score=81.12 Phypoly_transcript_02702:95-2080(+)
MERLVDKVKGILESAVQNDDKSRLTILNEFFSNISCLVEDEVLLLSDLRTESKKSTTASISSTSSTTTTPTTRNSPLEHSIPHDHFHEDHSNHYDHCHDHHGHDPDQHHDHYQDYDQDHSHDGDSDHAHDQEDSDHNNNNYSDHDHPAHDHHSIDNFDNPTYTSDCNNGGITEATRILDKDLDQKYTNENDNQDSGVESDRESYRESDTASDSSISLDPTVTPDILLSHSVNPLATSTTPAPALVCPPPPLISTPDSVANAVTSSTHSSIPISSTSPLVLPTPSEDLTTVSPPVSTPSPPSSPRTTSSSTTNTPVTPIVESQSNSTRPLTMYYYELLAERFATHPSDVAALFQVIISLWSNPTFPIIFAALFYKWMFKHGAVQMKHFNLFIKGANRLFWLDLETINTRFASIYKFLNNEVLLSYTNIRHDNKNPHSLPPSLPAIHGSVLSQFLLDFFNVLGRFFFYYQKVSDMPLFIEQTQTIFTNVSKINTQNNTNNNHDNATTITSDSNNIVTIADTDLSAQNTAPTYKELAKISAADNFVDCTIRQIKLIKNEYVLVKYIQKCVHFRGLTLTDTTQVKLQTLLYDYTSPGGPSYPPRSVRHAATESLDALFPTGRLPRRYIHLFFRLLHPYYASRSIFHWFIHGTKHTNDFQKLKEAQ